MKTYYADYNATTPLDERVLQVMQPLWSRVYANASSLHAPGREAEKAVRDARRQVAGLIGACDEREIIFTSGGTESNNAVLRSALATGEGRNEIVVSAVEHSSIRALCSELGRTGYRIIEVGVDGRGCLEMDELRRVLSEKTALVSLMMANNETGALFPVEAAGALVKSRGIPFHVDAVQAAGKIPVSMRNSTIDFLSLSAHKFGGPKGVGALYVRQNTPFSPLLFGGNQERGRRAGTLNVPGIAGMGEAARWVSEDLDAETARVEVVRDAFESKVRGRFEDVVAHAASVERLPNTSHLGFPGLDGEALLMALDQQGVFASQGTACLSGSGEPSYVLKAMGKSDEVAAGSVRFSFGGGTSLEDAEAIAAIVCDTVIRLRNLEKENYLTAKV